MELKCLCDVVFEVNDGHFFIHFIYMRQGVDISQHIKNIKKETDLYDSKLDKLIETYNNLLYTFGCEYQDRKKEEFELKKMLEDKQKYVYLAESYKKQKQKHKISSLEKLQLDKKIAESEYRIIIVEYDYIKKKLKKLSELVAKKFIKHKSFFEPPKKEIKVKKSYQLVHEEKKEILKVSGPLNTIRLEGKINGTKKVLYVFMDEHRNKPDETRCDLPAERIGAFLRQTFSEKKDLMYDFFSEISSKDYGERHSPLDKIYIDETFDLAQEGLLNKNKFENVRFHYIDFRDHLFGSGCKLTDAEYMMHKFSSEIVDIKPEDLQSYLLKMIDMTDHYINTLNIIQDLFYGKIIKSDDARFRPIEKIKGKYDIKYVKDKINDIIDNELVYYVHDLMYEYNDIKKILKKLHANPDINIYRHVLDRLHPHRKNILLLAAHIIDCYFLRRFLDKNYIKNGVVYVGLAHGIFYVRALVKYFNFKITHYSYLGEDIREITKILKASPDSSERLRKYFTYDKNGMPLDQCSDLSSFPPLFT